MAKPTDFSMRTTEFLSMYLPGQLRLSPNTITSYKDTFILLIRFMIAERGKGPEQIVLGDIDRSCITGFLDWLESCRGCSPATRNVRLSAMKSFCRFLQLREPDRMLQWQEISCIPIKKSDESQIEYLTLDGVRLLLAQPDPSTTQGLRDLALLSFLYDSAARVQEAIDVTPARFRLDPPCTVELFGKGAKSRVVPLLDTQTSILRLYIEANDLQSASNQDVPLFKNRNGQAFTRAGVNYVLKKHFETAKLADPGILPRDIHCHCLRHSKAVHLLQAGVNLVYIRDILGHKSVVTTEIYARIDSKQKRLALENAHVETSPDVKAPRWLADNNLLLWLKEFDKGHC